MPSSKRGERERTRVDVRNIVHEKRQRRQKRDPPLTDTDIDEDEDQEDAGMEVEASEGDDIEEVEQESQDDSLPETPPETAQQDEHDNNSPSDEHPLGLYSICSCEGEFTRVLISHAQHVHHAACSLPMWHQALPAYSNQKQASEFPRKGATASTE
jgi:hypothetical protein